MARAENTITNKTVDAMLRAISAAVAKGSIGYVPSSSPFADQPQGEAN